MDHNHLQMELAKGRRVIYLATRLFNISDKLATAKLEASILEGVVEGFAHLKIDLSVYPLYMPYRDTNEDQLHDNTSIYDIIYRNDMLRLNSLYAMLAYLDNPSKDDGICMEFGVAYARRVPTVAFSSDIQLYLPGNHLRLASVADPVVYRMMGKIVHSPNLPPSSNRATTDIADMRNFAAEYIDRLMTAEDRILAIAKSIAKELIISPDKYMAPFPIYEPSGGVFIEFLGNREEWAREYVLRISESLERKGIRVSNATRHDLNFVKSRHFDHAGQIGECDIRKLLESDVVIICAEGAEVDAGASALVGLALAVGKHIVLYYSGSTNIAEGVAICRRNLMIEYSANHLSDSLEDVVRYTSLYIASG